MTVVESTEYAEYLNNLSNRKFDNKEIIVTTIFKKCFILIGLVKPNMLLIWSMAHPLFPQLLLRIADDVRKLEWHPVEDEILVGGCSNGQMMIWDIGEYLPKLKREISIWDHEVAMDAQTDK